MKKMRCVGVIGVATAVVLLGSVSCVASQTNGKNDAASARDKISGVWRGNSVCVDRSSPCHDEVNVYRFEEIAGKPDAFTVTASKVVDGKEIEMGRSEFKYDEKTRTVESEKPRIRLTLLRDSWMEGALSLEDGKEYRRIRLKKAS